MTRPRSGLLIIRAWAEPGSSSPLRAHIRSTTDVSHGFKNTLTVAQEDATIEAVQAWLSDLLASARDAGDGPDAPS